jgi:hypothetical protein
VRLVLAISTVVAALTSSCGGATSPEPVPVSVVDQVTMTTTPTITSSRPPQTPNAAVPSDSDHPTEEVLPVDMADPERLISLDMGVDVAVSTASRTQGVIDPIQGQVIWVPVGDRDAGPGEEGLVLMAAHLNTGEPFYDLIDDSAKDRKHGADDHGISVGAVFDFRLVDGTVCRYVVIEPFGVGIEGVETVPGQPAIYFPKQAEVMNPILAKLIADVGQRPIVMMWVSYAGPNNDQWKPNGRNRANNAVVFSQLDLCNDSENG